MGRNIKAIDLNTCGAFATRLNQIFIQSWLNCGKLSSFFTLVLVLAELKDPLVLQLEY